MNITIIITAIAILLLFIMLIVLFLFFTKKHHEKQKSDLIPIEYTIDELLVEVDRAKSAQRLEELIEHYLNTQFFEPKAKSLSNSMKKKLDFITRIALNKEVNAAIIVKLNKQLQEKYEAYKNEIEIYEKIGIIKRKMRS